MPLLLSRCSAPLRRLPRSQTAKSKFFRAQSSFGPLGSNVGINTSTPPEPIHVFQPMAMRPGESPMRVATTWMTALKARQQKRDAWEEANAEKLKEGVLTRADMPVNTYSHSEVGTLDVVERSPKESFSYVVLPFKKSEWLLDAYINAPGRLRIGQVFQDLDGLAGVIAYRHCYPATPVIITASVDRIYMKKRLSSLDGLNVTLSGNVTWTGRSSMEITIKAATHSEDLALHSTITPDDIQEENVFLTANFTFVARHPETERAMAINKLVPETKSEKLEFVRAEKYNAHKRQQAKSDLSIMPPSEQESRILHNMWLQQKPDPETAATTAGAVTQVSHMHESRVTSTAIMQPQYRNCHSYMIFGGYLLRQTYELASACAAKFSASSPRFVALDSTTFRNPVFVGSILNLSATVVYTEFIHRQAQDPDADTSDVSTAKHCHHVASTPGTLIQVRVDSTVQDLSGSSGAPPKSTNTGHFTYSFFVAASPKLAGAEEQQPKYFSVLPQTYAEMMDYLQGRRKSIETANFNTYVRLLPNPKEIVTE